MQLCEPSFALIGEGLSHLWHFQFNTKIVGGEFINDVVCFNDLRADLIQLISDKQSVFWLQAPQATFRRWDPDAVASGPRLDEIQQDPQHANSPSPL